MLPTQALPRFLPRLEELVRHDDSRLVRYGLLRLLGRVSPPPHSLLTVVSPPTPSLPPPYQLHRYVAGALLNLHANLRHTERGTQLQWLSTLVRPPLLSLPLELARPLDHCVYQTNTQRRPICESHLIARPSAPHARRNQQAKEAVLARVRDERLRGLSERVALRNLARAAASIPTAARARRLTAALAWARAAEEAARCAMADRDDT